MIQDGAPSANFWITLKGYSMTLQSIIMKEGRVELVSVGSAWGQSGVNVRVGGHIGIL